MFKSLLTFSKKYGIIYIVNKREVIIMNLDTFMIFPQIEEFERELFTDDILKECFFFEEEKQNNQKGE